MTDKLFYKLWKDALAKPDKEMYIHEYGYPEYFDEISEDPAEVVEILGKIHDVAHMSVRDILEYSGLSQGAVSRKFCIPLRTVENWATDVRQCPDYIRLMFCRELKILEV